MNSWLQQMHPQLYLELDGLRKGHPSGRDNGRWIAETQGKLDACTLLKDAPTDVERINEVRRMLNSKPMSDVVQNYLEYYKIGASNFLDKCT